LRREPTGDGEPERGDFRSLFNGGKVEAEAHLLAENKAVCEAGSSRKPFWHTIGQKIAVAQAGRRGK
jgi:hypothetical protein